MDLFRNKTLYHRVFFPDETGNFTEPHETFQMRVATLPTGKKVDPHGQSLVEMNPTPELVEVWYVVSGTGKVRLFDDTGYLLYRSVVSSGFTIMTYRGFHELESTDNLKILEIKNHPFTNIIKTTYAENP